MAVFLLLLGYLTLTSVVFEYSVLLYRCNVFLNLTLTSVVFEYNAARTICRR